MKRWLTSLFFLISLVVSVPAGTSFSQNGMNKSVCPMKCCKKKSAKSTESKAKDVAICRTLNCSTPSPINSGTSSQINFAPNLSLSESVSVFEILFESAKEKTDQPSFETVATLDVFQPKYIQFQSFLI